MWVGFTVMRNVLETGKVDARGRVLVISVIFVRPAKVALEKAMISLHFLTFHVS